MPSFIPKPPNVTGLNKSNLLSSGIIGAWPMTEGSTEATIFDASFMATDGIQVGNPTWEGSSYGYTMDFDGTGDCLDLGISPFYTHSATSFSISFIATISTNDFNGTVKLLMDSSAANPATGGFWLAVDDRGGSNPVNGLQWRFNTSGNSNSTIYSANNVFTTTPTCYHIVCSYNSSTSTGEIQVNGVDVTNVYSAPSGDFVPKNADLFFCSSNINTFNFNGQAHAPVIWDRYLSPSEAKALYHDHFQIYKKNKRTILYRILAAVTGNPYYAYMQQ